MKIGTVLFQDISLALTADYTLFQAPGLQTEKPPFPLSLVGENREADLSRERCRECGLRQVRRSARRVLRGWSRSGKDYREGGAWKAFQRVSRSPAPPPPPNKKKVLRQRSKGLGWELAPSGFKLDRQAGPQAYKGLTLGLMLCCCHCEILKNFWTKSSTFSHFSLGPTNYIAEPAWSSKQQDGSREK